MGTILLVEREAAERDTVMRAVGTDHRVIAIDTLEQAWAKLAEVDLLVVGLEQSDDADLTVLDRVHALRPGLPVVLTASATLHGWQVLRTGMRLGARDFLTKPFDEQEVRHTIAVALQRATPDTAALTD